MKEEEEEGYLRPIDCSRSPTSPGYYLATPGGGEGRGCTCEGKLRRGRMERGDVFL